MSYKVALLLFLLCSVPASAQPEPAAQVGEDFQQRFETGAERLFSGQYLAAAATFEQLYEDTQSDRVKLEWARSLYLAGEYERATFLFREVIENDPPLVVSNRVSALIRDMELQRLKIDVTLGLATDTNPRTITAAQSLNIFGYDFSYDPGIDRGRQLGVSYGVTASKSFGSQRRYIASLSIAGNEFEGGDFDNVTISGSGLYYVSLSPRIYLKPTYETTYFAQKALYRVPYLALGASTDDVIADTNLGLELRVGQLSYSDYDYLDATHYAATLNVSRYINEDWNLGLQLFLTRNEANSTPYTSNTYGVQVSSAFSLHALSLVVQTQLGYTLRPYAGADIFFNLVREDERLRGHLGLELRKFQVRGFAPVVELSWEKNFSNIPLYSYTRGTWGLSFRRAF
jgi:hypothetical protein